MNTELNTLKNKVLAIAYGLSALMAVAAISGCSKPGPRSSDIVQALSLILGTDVLEARSAEVTSVPTIDGTFDFRFVATVRTVVPLYIEKDMEDDDWSGLFRGASAFKEAEESLRKMQFAHNGVFSQIPNPPKHPLSDRIIVEEHYPRGHTFELTGVGRARDVNGHWGVELDLDSLKMEMHPDVESLAILREYNPIVWDQRSDRRELADAVRQFIEEVGRFESQYAIALEAHERKMAELEEKRRERQTRVLNQFSEGRILLGSFSEAGSRSEVSFRVESIDRATGAIRFTIRNDGGWSVSREGTGTLNFPNDIEAAVGMSLQLGLDTRIRDAGPLLSQGRFALRLTETSEGTWQGTEGQLSLELNASPEDVGVAHMALLKETEAAISKLFNEGSFFDMDYRSRGFSHRFVLRVTAFNPATNAFSGEIISLETPDLNRDVEGRIQTHRYLASSGMLRIDSPTGTGSRSTRDPVFRSNNRIAWALSKQEEGSFAFSDNTTSISAQSITPTDAETLLAVHERSWETLLGMFEQGSQLRGTLTRSNRRETFILDVTRSDRAGEVIQVRLFDPSLPSIYAIYEGSLNRDSLSIRLTRRSERNRQSQMALIGSFLSQPSIELDFHTDSQRLIGGIQGQAGYQIQVASREVSHDDIDHATVSRHTSEASGAMDPIEERPAATSHALAETQASPSTPAEPLPSDLPTVRGAFIRQSDGQWTEVQPVDATVRQNLLGIVGLDVGANAGSIRIDDNRTSSQLSSETVEFFYNSPVRFEPRVPEANNLPHMVNVSADRRNRWNIPLRLIVDGFIGVPHDQHFPASVQRAGSSGYLLTTTRPVARGRYAILVNELVYVLEIN